MERAALLRPASRCVNQPAPRRCAIYTRKSSDERLDQAFNSLDAQREAGEAYVKSQASEGWQVVTARYDDGGYSGGTMERPGLQRLLGDVEAGRIDVVVVYKIDRLTRSLADFARIVEQFDARGVSFVSVTQAFNTTSSMGRLTLNVLLSFAQFEREVTGERIRDKIAASKAKGMWMGGLPPLGYDLPAPGTRKLLVNAAEAEQVRHIFARYLELRSVHRLADDLAARGITSKCHVTAAGKCIGGERIGRGALFHLLRNQLYLGKITHKGTAYNGEHEAIIDRNVFAEVQELLTARPQRRVRIDGRLDTAAFIGKIVDAAGELMSPTSSRGRGGRLYRYYVSASLQRGTSAPADADYLRRVPAPAIEGLILAVLGRLLPANKAPMSQVDQVRLGDGLIELDLVVPVARIVHANLADGEAVVPTRSGCRLSVPLLLPLRGGKASIMSGSRNRLVPDPVLVGALRKAHRLLSRDTNGLPTVHAAPKSPYERSLLRLGLLAPDIQQAILSGQHPRNLNLETLLRLELPLDWPEQRRILGLKG